MVFAKPWPLHCHQWGQDWSMKFHGNISHKMGLKWFGILDEWVGKIFRYWLKTDISETRRKLAISGITLLLFGLWKHVIYYQIENLKIYFLYQQKYFGIPTSGQKNLNYWFFLIFLIKHIGNHACSIASQWKEIFQWNLLETIVCEWGLRFYGSLTLHDFKMVSYRPYSQFSVNLLDFIFDFFASQFVQKHLYTQAAGLLYHSTYWNFMEISS